MGWTQIDVRYMGELNDQERAEIELEENIRRKDLTPYELSKELVRKAEQIAPVISGKLPEKDARGRKSKYPASKEEVAAAMGTSKSQLIRAEQHVTVTAKYPELAAQDIPQRDAIAMAKTLDDLPSGEELLPNASRNPVEPPPPKDAKHDRRGLAFHIPSHLVVECVTAH